MINYWHENGEDIDYLLDKVFVPAFGCRWWDQYLRILKEEGEKILDRLKETTETRGIQDRNGHSNGRNRRIKVDME